MSTTVPTDEPAPDAMAATVDAQFAGMVAARPDEIAVVGYPGAHEPTLTYRELSDRVNRLAHAVLDADATGRARDVGVLLGQGVDAVVASMAPVVAGRASVMLDPATPPTRLAELVARLGPVVVLTDRAHRTALSAADPALVTEVLVDADHRDRPTSPPAVTVSPDDAFSITFTSGSTGRPKGVIRTHAIQMQSVRRQRAEGRTGPDHRVAQVFDYQFAAGRGATLGALLAGSSLHLYPTRDVGVVGLARWIADQRITHLATTPSLMATMLDVDPPVGTWPSMRRISFLADVLPTSVPRRLRAHLPPDAIMVNGYASSEGGMIASYTITADTPLEGDLVPAGEIRSHARIEIVDQDEDGVGEIVVTSPSVAAGYLDEPSRQASFAPRDGALGTFHTGDLGRLRPDGLLEYRGRVDHRMKVRGHTVDPSEIERALRSLPGIVEAAAGLDRSRPRRPRLVAHVVAEPGTDVTVSALRRSLRGLLPPYMIPVAFVRLDALPRTTRGKLDRDALPPPPPGRPPLDAPFEAPADETEQTIAEVFGRVLEVTPVGRHDEFFDLGGDSLAAAEAMTAMSAAFGHDLPLAVFLQTSTPAALAAHYRRGPVAQARLVVLQAGGARPPIVCIHGGGGQVLSYAGLAERLPHDRAFAAVQMLADDRARRLLWVRRLAASYARGLTRAHPGPLVVAGHSYGGVVAFETARILARRGHVVEACILLDTPLPSPIVVARRLRAGGALPVGAEDGGPGGDVDRMAPVRELGYVAHAALGLVPQPHRLTTERVIAAVWGAAAYRPRPSPVPLVVVRATRSRFDAERWRPFAAGSFTVVDVPGDHQSILMPPHLDTLAATLGELLAARPGDGGDAP